MKSLFIAAILSAGFFANASSQTSCLGQAQVIIKVSSQPYKTGMSSCILEVMQQDIIQYNEHVFCPLYQDQVVTPTQDKGLRKGVGIELGMKNGHDCEVAVDSNGNVSGVLEQNSAGVIHFID